MIYSVFTYNGERDILRLHMECTPWVDKYIIVEANQTFSGHPKHLYFFQENRFFKPWWRKIDYFIVNNWNDQALWDMADASPNTAGAHHWKREFYIKESIHKAFKAVGVNDGDMVYLGDVDEIPRKWDGRTPVKLKLDVYAYYLNNRSNEQFWGTLVAPYSYLKDKILNHERSRTDIRTGEFHGWHFTSQGGLKEVERKLHDSYTPESYDTASVQAGLPERHALGIDCFGRNFAFITDESAWPEMLIKNRSRYSHLCR